MSAYDPKRTLAKSKSRSAADPDRMLDRSVCCHRRLAQPRNSMGVTMPMRFKDALWVISIGRILLAAAASGAVLATNAFAQSAREVRDASPYVAIENEPPPKLTVDPTPLAAGLAHDIVWIQYHAENVRIGPVFGTAALNVSTDRTSARTHRRSALGLGGSDG